MTQAMPGLDRERLLHLKATIESDIADDRYFGAVIAVARHGEIGLAEAIGHGDEAKTIPLKQDSVFSLFSLTKAFTNALVFRAIELGQFALTTRVSEIIPEFKGGMRETVTFFHLLTHSSGLPPVWIPKPGMCIDRLDEIIEAICANIRSLEPPGERVHYSPLVHHALMGEAVRRCDPDGRSYRELLEDEVLTPLGMNGTAIGLRKDLAARHIFPDFRGKPPQDHLGRSNLGPQGAFKEEHAEMPWVGGVSTVPDLLRFAEMLRLGGALDGHRIVSRAMLRLATRNWTADKPNELYKSIAINHGWEPYPAYIGLGFGLRGDKVCPNLFGTLTTPGTFGHYGSGSTLFWVDPELDLSFVCLSAGVMQPAPNIERFQRLSDIAASAAL
ncbi:MAG TPA: serine hydrolase domain-containing protein [Gammaproteobacteria bacterium]|nr:serine hydrolase domain-containing protein [Gammaproteobacteria bacterium]